MLFFFVEQVHNGDFYMTVQEALDAFLNEREPAARKLGALALRFFQEQFEQTTGEPLSFSNWTRQDTREYIGHMLNVRHLKPKSINAYLSQLRAFAAWCVDNEYLQRDPTRGVKGMTEQKREVKALDRTEENRLLRALEQEDPIYRFILVFLMHTGLRNSELAALQLRDIELGEEHATLDAILSHVPQPGAYRSGILYVRAGKGMKAREVHLNATAREVLLDYLRIRPHIDSTRLLISLKRRQPDHMGYLIRM